MNAENTPIELNVELVADTDCDFDTLESEAIALSPEGIALNSASWSMRETIAREIAPQLEAIRKAKAELFKRFEDRYCTDTFDGALPTEPTEAELQAIDAELATA